MANQNGSFRPDRIYTSFIKQMDKKIDGGSDDNERLMNNLFSAEKKFRDTLLSTKNGRKVYNDFIDFFRTENFLSSRVYFREKQSSFKSKISKALRDCNAKSLYRLRINFIFARWAMSRVGKNAKNKLLNRYYEEIQATRHTVCQNNLPLAINRSQVFFRKVPFTQLTYLDMIQTSSEGLMISIDKFVPPYRDFFRNFSITRMISNILTDHSDTLVKIPAKERRILYRANKARQKTDSKEEIVKYVNESFVGVSKKEIQEITTAAVAVSSLDDPMSEDGCETMGDITPGNIDNPEVSTEKADNLRVASELIDSLSVLEQKLIKLKYGISK